MKVSLEIKNGQDVYLPLDSSSDVTYQELLINYGFCYRKLKNMVLNEYVLYLSKQPHIKVFSRVQSFNNLSNFILKEQKV